MATTSIWPINGSISMSSFTLAIPIKTIQTKFSDSDLSVTQGRHGLCRPTNKDRTATIRQRVNCLPKLLGNKCSSPNSDLESSMAGRPIMPINTYKPGETTPEIAHSIGVEFAEKALGRAISGCCGYPCR
jgi:hypothetical protein